MNLNDFSGRSRNADHSKPLVPATPEDLRAQPAPFIPPSLKSFKGMSYLPLYLQSLKESSMFEQSTGDQFKAAITLFMSAWESDPPCSVPNHKPSLERILRLDANEFMECMKQGPLKNGFLNGWILCSNNRFYHPDLARAMATTMNRFAHKDYDMQRARHKKDIQRGKLSDADAARTQPELKLLAYDPNPDELPIFKIIKPEMVAGRIKSPEDFNFVDGWEKLLSRHPYDAESMREMSSSVFDESFDDDDDDNACPNPVPRTNESVPGTNQYVPTTNPDSPEDRLRQLDSFAICPGENALKEKVKDKEKGKDNQNIYQQEGVSLRHQFDLDDELVVESLMARNTAELRSSALAESQANLPTQVPEHCFKVLDVRSFWNDLGTLGFTDPVKSRMEFTETVVNDLISLGVKKPVIDRAYEMMVKKYGRTPGQTVALFKTILVNFVANLGCLIKASRYFSEDILNSILALSPQTIVEFERMMKRDPIEATNMLRMYCQNPEGLRQVIWSQSRQQEGRDAVQLEANTINAYNPLLELGVDRK